MAAAPLAPRAHERADSSKPAFLCERSYTNFAWGYQSSGIYIDTNGHVFRFDARTRPPSSLPPTDSIPHDELEARYAQNRTQTAVVSPDKLTSVRAQVAVAANG